MLPQKPLQGEMAFIQVPAFEQLQLRAMMRYQDSQGNHGVASVRFRIHKDKIIWFSVTMALGIEAMRGIITPTGITILNRIQEEYYDYNYASLRTHLGYSCNYDLIQALLLGALPFASYDSQKIVQKGAGQVVVRQKKAPWVLTQVINCATSNQEKRITLVDMVTQGGCTVDYERFKEFEEGAFPEKFKICLYSNAYQVHPKIVIAMDKVKVSCPKKTLDFPFSIPPHYEKK